MSLYTERLARSDTHLARRRAAWRVKRQSAARLVATAERRLEVQLKRLGELEKCLEESHEKIRACRVALTTVRGFAHYATDAPIPLAQLQKLVAELPR